MNSDHPFGLGTPNEALPPELQRYLEALYLRAWTAYAEAGCPFGTSEDAMLIWFEFDQQTRPN